MEETHLRQILRQGNVKEPKHITNIRFLRDTYSITTILSLKKETKRPNEIVNNSLIQKHKFNKGH